MSCSEKISEYVEKVDALLEKERNSTVPFRELNRLYFPFGPCEWQEVLDAVSKSKFVETIVPAGAGIDVIALSNGSIEVGFSFLSKERRSQLDYVRFKKF